MKIGIIGSGHIGSTLARLFVAHANEVAISNSRGPDTLRELETELGGHAQAMSAEQAARFGEMVVISVPFKSYDEVPVGGLSGKVVIDTNNYYPDRDGHFEELDADRTTSSELLAQRLGTARVVKAFNAIRWDSLRDKPRTDGGERVGIPISGDDPHAKALVAGLIDQIGFTAVDAGSLADGGRKHQPGTPVYAADLPAHTLHDQLRA